MNYEYVKIDIGKWKPQERPDKMPITRFPCDVCGFHYYADEKIKCMRNSIAFEESRANELPYIDRITTRWLIDVEAQLTDLLERTFDELKEI